MAELVKDNLFFYILKDKDFESDIEKAIMNGCRIMDQKIKENHDQGKENKDKSGSCAIFVIIKSKLD